MNEPRRHPRVLRSFTLAELLVVMGLIAILATITVVAVGAIANDARLATGRNTVVAALDNARSLALRDNQLVLVAFRARLSDPAGNEQVVEAVTAKWTGESFVPPGTEFVIDRFVPFDDVPARALPRGIKIAAPLYVWSEDKWVTSSHLPAIERNGEREGVVIAVMYAPDGTVVTQNSRSNSSRIFVDFDRNVFQYQDGDRNQGFIDHTGYCDLGDNSSGGTLTEYYCQRHPDDEPYLIMAPFLAVFDDDEAREILDPSRWVDPQPRIDDLTAHINERADRIHFNRYTGVAMK